MWLTVKAVKFTWKKQSRWKLCAIRINAVFLISLIWSLYTGRNLYVNFLSSDTLGEIRRSHDRMITEFRIRIIMRAFTVYKCLWWTPHYTMHFIYIYIYITSFDLHTHTMCFTDSKVLSGGILKRKKEQKALVVSVSQIQCFSLCFFF